MNRYVSSAGSAVEAIATAILPVNQMLPKYDWSGRWKLFNSIFLFIIIPFLFYIASIGPFGSYDETEINKIDNESAELDFSAQISHISTMIGPINLFWEKIKLIFVFILLLTVLNSFFYDLEMRISGKNLPYFIKLKKVSKSNLVAAIIKLVMIGYIGRLLLFSSISLLGVRAANNISFIENSQSILPINTAITSLTDPVEIFLNAMSSPLRGPELIISDSNWAFIFVVGLGVARVILLTFLLGVFLFILPALKESIANMPIYTEERIRRFKYCRWAARLGEKVFNEGFQNSWRADSYVITQDVIVPRSNIYKHIADGLVDKYRVYGKSINILIPGIGTAPFITYLIKTNHQLLKMSKKLKIVGVDISQEMVDRGVQQIIENISPENDYNVELKLLSGYNLLSNKEVTFDYMDETMDKFNVIISMQFEHYCPNSNNSPLAIRLRKEGIRYYTKSENLKRYYKWLTSGGTLFVFDDYLGESEEETNKLNYDWDKYVAEKFTDKATLDEIKQLSNTINNKIMTIYGNMDDLKDVISAVEERRKKRRMMCLEEIDTVEKTERDLNKIFKNDETAKKLYLISELKQFVLFEWHKGGRKEEKQNRD